VNGKGIKYLLDHGIEVEFYPQELQKERIWTSIWTKCLDLWGDKQNLDSLRMALLQSIRSGGFGKGKWTFERKALMATGHLCLERG